MARYPDRGSSDVSSLYSWQGGYRTLFGSFSINIGLRCSGISGHLPDVDLLLGADPAVRG